MAYYDRQGRPLTVLEWAPLFVDMEYRRIAKTTLPDGTWISTVWLGLNLDFLGRGPPLIFESMVFGKGDEEDQQRYSTLEEAEAGHEQLVAKWIMLTVD